MQQAEEIMKKNNNKGTNGKTKKINLLIVKFVQSLHNLFQSQYMPLD